MKSTYLQDLKIYTERAKELDGIGGCLLKTELEKEKKNDILFLSIVQGENNNNYLYLLDIYVPVTFLVHNSSLR